MRTSATGLILAVSIACLGGSVASADSVTLPFYDGFETYAPGTYPSPPWSVYYSGNYAVVSTEQAYSGSNSFEISGDSGFSRADTVAVLFPNTFTFSTAFMVKPGSPGGMVGMAQSWGGASPINGLYISAAENRIDWVGSGGGTTLLDECVAGKWYKADITIKDFWADSSMADVTITYGAASVTRTGIPAYNRTQADLGWLQLHTFSRAPSTMYFDDVRIYRQPLLLVTPDFGDITGDITRVRAVWRENLTGEGIVLGILDDGLPDCSAPTLKGKCPAYSPVAWHPTEVAAVAIGHSEGGVVAGHQIRSALGELLAQEGDPLTFRGVAFRSQLVAQPYSEKEPYQRLDLLAQQGAAVINMSVSDAFAWLPVFSSSNPQAATHSEGAVDRFVETKGLPVVIAAGNCSAIDGGIIEVGNVTSPGGAFNAITVGASEKVDKVPGKRGVFHDGTGGGPNNEGSSSGVAYDPFLGRRRCKPDMVAPGQSVYLPAYGTNKISGAGVGTSIAAPQVSGAVALLLQAAKEESIEDGEDPRVIKSVLLNSATKLPGFRKPVWIREEGTPVGMVFTYTQEYPLDLQQGAGELNAEGALAQLRAGRQHDGTVPWQGWSLEPIGQGDTDVYSLSARIGGASTIIGTLVWYRHIDEGLLGYEVRPLSNLDLSVLRVDQQGQESSVDRSVSTIDNVEHIYYEAFFDGYYSFHVNGTAVTPAQGETYALAWRVVPPTVSLQNRSFSAGDASGWRINERFGSMPPPDQVGTVEVIHALDDVANYVARLIAGSPTSVSQPITTPEEPFRLEFDCLFEQAGGELRVFLDEQPIGGPLSGTAVVPNEWQHVLLEVADPALLGLGELDLTFVFYGASGQALLLDNVGSQPIPEPGVASLLLLGGLFAIWRRGNSSRDRRKGGVAPVTLRRAVNTAP